MIVWLNGTFGAGKTTTAAELARLLGARTFDTEFVGYLLRTAFPEHGGDFQPCRCGGRWSSRTPRGCTNTPARW
ncbi:hypothetical protein SAMN04489727_3418 [Amycolatopsis tolypomycina]|uniref:AAA domain-containing protein n=1 Tax=Amycolatopsis tolypomycina TaxID=208445 RepID=A0A1H4RS14_9PSEU|nr:hypothetical protein [Amycolatopsis tolypomycina]SEC34411.1 hypothetical protein SAMN04489727_3418 [Amycolatopsis tolypomycina]